MSPPNLSEIFNRREIRYELGNFATRQNIMEQKAYHTWARKSMVLFQIKLKD